MKDKVAFVIDSLNRGGAETSLLEIVSRFKRFDPVFVQLFDGNDLHAQFRAKNIEVVQIGCHPSYQFGKIAMKALPAIEKINPVLIHSTLFRGDMTARQLKPSVQIPLINSLVNNSYSDVRYRSLSMIRKVKLRVIQQWDAITARNVDLFISNSETIKKSNAKALGISLEKIKVIYRGRDYRQYSDVNDAVKRKVRSELGLSDQKIFLNVSRLLNRKGQLDLLRAFAIVYNNNPDTVLLIAGEGNYRSELEKAIESLKLQRCVMLLGKRTDVANLLRASDFFVFPSHYEGLPGSLIEAMMSRIPIIASDISENLECVSAKTAFLHRAGDAVDLSRAMQDALETQDWKVKVDFAFETALDQFDIDHIASHYEETYEQLLNRSTSTTLKTN